MRFGWLIVTMAMIVAGCTSGNGSTDSVSLPFGSFYNGWDPDSQFVASLGVVERDVILTLTDPSTGEFATVGQGVRLFLSWEAGGDRIAMNTGGVLRVITTDGAQLFGRPSSEFLQTPVWIPGGAEVLAVVDQPRGPAVVAIDVETGGERTLLLVSGPTSMVIDPMGTMVAILHVADTSGVVSAGFSSAQPTVPSGSSLFLVDLATGDVTEIADAQRGGVFWSPTGYRLLSVVVDATDGELWFRWQVHTAEGELTG